MKKLLFSFALVIAITAVTSAQHEPYSYVSKVLTGEWKWTAYSGGAKEVPSTEAPANYTFTMSRDTTVAGLMYNCSVFKDEVYLYSTRMHITENPTNDLFPYTLHHDITAPLFNGAAMPSIHFRIAEANILEFSNGSKVDFRYVFKNISPSGKC